MLEINEKTKKKKEINDMTNEEILRQQLELLAEVSKIHAYEDLPKICSAMVEIYEILTN